MSIYELLILGNVEVVQRDRLTNTIKEMIDGFGLDEGRDFSIRTGGYTADREIKSATAAAYFGGAQHSDVDVAQSLIRAGVPIIPTIGQGLEFASSFPVFLRRFNGHRLRSSDVEMEELAAAMLECVGLLRRQRRLFLSYRRVESRTAALQLHDLLVGKGFDVFLDTHDIRPGDPFQDVLWHRLCDSDVVVMLDTPQYFQSKWTRQEIGRASAKEIHVLRVIWPDYTPTNLAGLNETIYLRREDLLGMDGPVTPEIADHIALAVERLRSRSIAARYMSITGKFRADVERIGGMIEGIGAHRAISVKLPDDRKLWAYPVVGVPTAELLNDVAQKAERANQEGKPILVYDHVGIHDAWSAHLKWLDENISSVRAVKVSEAGWVLAAWDE